MEFHKFKEIAERNNGKVKKFVQNEYMAHFPFDAATQNGICRALSAAYLVRNGSREAGNDKDFGDKKFFEAFHVGRNQSEKDQKRNDILVKAQKKGHKSGELSRQDKIDAAVDTVKTLSKSKLEKKQEKTVLTFSKSVSKDTMSGASLWLISGSGHMMAAVERKSKCKFFDPNLGQVVFSHPMNRKEDFARFANEFLDDGHQTTLWIGFDGDMSDASVWDDIDALMIESI